MKFHDAANIFPLDDEHIGELAEDIKAHGQRCPIEILDEKILDGRRRWLACCKAGIEPSFVEVEVDDPVAYVLSLNLHRRHLTTSQAAMCAQRARAIYDAAAKERKAAGQKAGGAARHGDDSLVKNSPPSRLAKSRDQVGRAFGVSRFSVGQAKKVLSDDAIPELAAAVDAGKISVSCAAQIALNPMEHQDRLLADSIAKVKPPKAPKVKEREPTGDERSKSKAIFIANEAVDALKRIPPSDPLRKRGFQIVTDWIRKNK